MHIKHNAEAVRTNSPHFILMTLRTHFLLIALLIATCALAQEGVPDTRLLPDIGSELVIDMVTPQEPDSNQVFMMVEEMPVFPGGMAALYAYVVQHLQYPDEAKEHRVEGLVLMQFIVEKDGAISEAQVCGASVAAAMKRRWCGTGHASVEAGQQGGKPVR